MVPNHVERQKTGMSVISSYERVIWICLVITTSEAVILTALFSLSHGINEIFPYFFLIPIFLVVYAFPKMGVKVTIILGCSYISLVWIFRELSAQVLAVHTAWFYVYISFGIVVSHYAESSRIHKEEAEQLKNEVFRQIETINYDFECLNEDIKNSLQAILLYTALSDERINTLCLENVKRIKKILDAACCEF